jgi:hypothetical protein
LKATVFGILKPVVWYKFTNVSDVLTASIIRAISFYQATQCNIPEVSHVYTPRLDNVKSHED